MDGWLGSVRRSAQLVAGRAPAGRDPSIRSLVFSLIAIALLPVLALSTWLAASYSEVQRARIEEEQSHVTHNLTLLLDRDILTVKSALEAVARAPGFGDLPPEAMLAALRPLAALPDIVAAQLYDKSGTLVMSTAPAIGQVLMREGPTSEAEAILAGSSVVTNVLRIAGSEEPVVGIFVLGYRQDRQPFALGAVMRTGRIHRLFTTAELRSAWIAGIVDRDGLFLARSRSPELYVGRSARPELVAVAKGSKFSGTFENVTLESVANVTTFERSSLTGWTSAVAVPKDVLSAPLRRNMTMVALLLGLVSLFSLIVASNLARRISEPVRQLSKVALAMIEGRPIRAARRRIAELNEVYAAFELAALRSGHLSAIVSSSGDAIIGLDTGGLITSWNTGAERLLGYQAADMLQQPLSRLLLDDEGQSMRGHVAAAGAGESRRVETHLRRRDATAVAVSIELAPIRGPDGSVVGLSMIAHDITGRIEAERQQHFLMLELNHRSKNLLAIVQSIAEQTGRSSRTFQDFRTDFSRRVQGLAASHELLLASNWTGASLADLVRSQLAPFIGEAPERLLLDGPETILDAKAAQALGLALHELATNSTKHGALSVPEGRVEMTWTLNPGAAAPERLQLEWNERNGPPVTVPDRKGFGHFVIEKMVAQSLEGQVAIDYRPDGLYWSLSIPLSRLAIGGARRTVGA